MAYGPSDNFADCPSRAVALHEELEHVLTARDLGQITPDEARRIIADRWGMGAAPIRLAVLDPQATGGSSFPRGHPVMPDGSPAFECQDCGQLHPTAVMHLILGDGRAQRRCPGCHGAAVRQVYAGNVHAITVDDLRSIDGASSAAATDV